MLRAEITKEFKNFEEALDFLEIYKDDVSEGEVIFVEEGRQLKIMGVPIAEMHELKELSDNLRLPPFSMNEIKVVLSVGISANKVKEKTEIYKKAGDFLDENKEAEKIRKEREEIENWIKKYAKEHDINTVRELLAENGIVLLKTNTIETLRIAKKCLEQGGDPFMTKNKKNEKK